ncbi:MAG: hypothetical protein IPM99_22220 [Rubrivivax sp.]|nr:hypothetical protein [Rubrivivax sp.]
MGLPCALMRQDPSSGWGGSRACRAALGSPVGARRAALIGAARRRGGPIAAVAAVVPVGARRARMGGGPGGRFLARQRQLRIQRVGLDAFEDAEIGLRQRAGLEIAQQPRPLAAGRVLVTRAFDGRGPQVGRWRRGRRRRPGRTGVRRTVVVLAGTGGRSRVARGA